MTKLWRSGMILSLAGLAGGLGNYLFQGLMGRHLERAEYGYLNSTLGFVGLLGLPLLVASTAVTHYIAHFQAKGDEARFQGLLAGCRKFLFVLTLTGSVVAMLVIKPLSDFFNFPRPTLMGAALVCVLAGLWGAFGTALCQGLAWFKRLALITLTGVALRLIFGWQVVLQHPLAETAVLATVFALLSNLLLLHWRKALMVKGEAISPWNREFAQYLIVAAACIGGGYCFTQGDLLVAQRNLGGVDLGNYTAAGLLARALPMVVGPMLAVLFTSRSGHRTSSVLGGQLLLLGLYAVGLGAGALGLLLFRGFFVKLIFGSYTPEAAVMVGRLALTMVFVGLLQALGTWALASRWFKVALLYGAVGLAYWLTLLLAGTSLQLLLGIMPVAAGVAFGLIVALWLITLRAHHGGIPHKSNASRSRV